MYLNKFTTSSMSSYSFSNLTFFREIPYSTCHKFIFSQQNCRKTTLTAWMSIPRVKRSADSAQEKKGTSINIWIYIHKYNE